MVVGCRRWEIYEQKERESERKVSERFPYPRNSITINSTKVACGVLSSLFTMCDRNVVKK